MPIKKTGIKIIAAITYLVLLSGCAAQDKHMYPKIKIDTRNLYSAVEKLTTVAPPRNYKNKPSLDNVAQYIKDKFSEYGFEPVEQTYKVNDITYKNIIASWGPQNSPVFVVGAHYDVYGEFPGADDNASGVAGIIELARLIGTNKPELNCKIELVAYTLEEPPFFRTEHMGSYVHAASLHKRNAEVIGMACLETIGYFTDSESSQAYPLSLMKLAYPGQGDFIAVVSNFGSSALTDHFMKNLAATSVNAEQLKAPSIITGVDFSDHLNYWKFGYKAIMITDTAFYRNANYHQESDTIETLDFEKMAEVIKGVYWTLINLKPTKNKT